jgi:hypothetical protein
MRYLSTYQQFYALVEVIEGKLTSVHSLYHALLVYFFRKAWKTLQSMFLLCTNGFGEDATILLRSLLELSINLQYIADDEERRAVLFCEYSHVEKNDFEKILRSFANDHPDDTIIATILKSKTKEQSDEKAYEYRKVMKNYPNPRNWADQSIRQMAKVTGMDFQYILYKMFCRISHPSPEGSDTYLKGDSEALICINSTIEDTNRTFWTGCIYFSSLLAHVDKAFELKLEAEISALQAKLRIELPT